MKVLEKYHAAAGQLALIGNNLYPLDSQWPNISIPDYYLIDESISNVTGSTSSTSILPLVYPSELSKFEAFALPFMETQAHVSEIDQVYHNVEGVWRFHNSRPIHDTVGNTSFSSRNIIVPILNPPKSIVEGHLVLANLHALQQAGQGVWKFSMCMYICCICMFACWRGALKQLQ